MKPFLNYTDEDIFIPGSPEDRLTSLISLKSQISKLATFKFNDTKILK